jgi:hypothetical protein
MSLFRELMQLLFWSAVTFIIAGVLCLVIWGVLSTFVKGA